MAEVRGGGRGGSGNKPGGKDAAEGGMAPETMRIMSLPQGNVHGKRNAGRMCP